MADLYPDHPQYARHDGPNNNGQFAPINNDVQYPPHANLPPPSTSSASPSSPEGDSPVQTTPKSEGGTIGSAVVNAAAARPEGKQQATFLTKLYAYVDACLLVLLTDARLTFLVAHIAVFLSGPITTI
jgi:hypothetical protein